MGVEKLMNHKILMLLVINLRKQLLTMLMM